MENERGLAGAVGAEQGHSFAGMELEIYAGQCDGAVLVLKVQIPNGNYGGGGRRGRSHAQIRAESAAASGRPAARHTKAASASPKRAAERRRKWPWNPRDTIER